MIETKAMLCNTRWNASIHCITFNRPCQCISYQGLEGKSNIKIATHSEYAILDTWNQTLQERDCIPRTQLQQTVAPFTIRNSSWVKEKSSKWTSKWRLELKLKNYLSRNQQSPNLLGWNCDSILQNNPVYINCWRKISSISIMPYIKNCQ
jgi:hypothetical protein